MKERMVLLSVLILLATGLFVLSSRPVTAQDDQPPTPSVPIETMGENIRELESISPNSLVGFIGTSNPYCYQPDLARDECYINIRYMQATDNGTTAPYLNALEVRLDGKLRYQSSVFFENSIYYNYNMIPDGLKVTCGSPNQGGAGADFGKVYSLSIQAKSGDGTSIGGNYAAVRCPAYVP